MTPPRWIVDRVTRDDSATARMEAARRNRARLIEDRNLVLAMLARVYPSHLARPSTKQTEAWDYTVCVHSPAGQLTWHITESEAEEFFKDLPREKSDWDGHRWHERADRIRAYLAQPPEPIKPSRRRRA